MYCVRCQNEVYNCTCPDIGERLASLANHKGFAMNWCLACDKHIDRCDCPDIGQEKRTAFKTGEEDL